MWRVAGFTSIDSYGGVFIKEGASFIGMAFQARLLILQARVDHEWAAAHLPRGTVSPMRVMTIRTGHETLVDPVFGCLGKLGSNVVVATVTDFSLPLCQEASIGFGLMDGMAGCTGDVSLRMAAAPDIRSICVFGVASQARVQYASRWQIGKSYNALFTTLCIYMLFPRPVAAFAPGILQRNTR